MRCSTDAVQPPSRSVFFKQEKLLENAFSSNFQHFPGFFKTFFFQHFCVEHFSSIFFQQFFAAKIAKNRFQQFPPKISLKNCWKTLFLKGFSSNFRWIFNQQFSAFFSSNFRRETAKKISTFFQQFFRN